VLYAEGESAEDAVGGSALPADRAAREDGGLERFVRYAQGHKDIWSAGGSTSPATGASGIPMRGEVSPAPCRVTAPCWSRHVGLTTNRHKNCSNAPCQ